MKTLYPICPEKLAMKKEEEAARKKALEVAAKEKTATDSTVSFPEITKEI